ncbi:MAG: hypothetical protein ACREHV_03695 [Rhizomicrobium sp.]
MGCRPANSPPVAVTSTRGPLGVIGHAVDHVPDGIEDDGFLFDLGKGHNASPYVLRNDNSASLVVLAFDESEEISAECGETHRDINLIVAVGSGNEFAPACCRPRPGGDLPLPDSNCN